MGVILDKAIAELEQDPDVQRYSLMQTEEGLPFYVPDPQGQPAQVGGQMGQQEAFSSSPPFLPSPDTAPRLPLPDGGPQTPIRQPDPIPGRKRGMGLVSTAEAAEPSQPGAEVPGGSVDPAVLDAEIQRLESELSGDPKGPVHAGMGPADTSAEEQELGGYGNYLPAMAGRVADILGIPGWAAIEGLQLLGADIAGRDGKPLKGGDAMKFFRSMLNSAGIPTRAEDPKSFAARTGEATVDGLVTLGGLFAAAPYVVASRAPALIKTLAETIRSHKALGIFTEFTAAPGAVAGQDLGETTDIPGAGIVGGIAGGLVTGGLGTLASKPIIGAGRMAGKAGDAMYRGLDRAVQAAGGPSIQPRDYVATARPTYRRGFVDPNADPIMSRVYAEDQIKGSILQVENAVQRELSGLQPTRGGNPLTDNSMQLSVRVAEGISRARQIAERIERDYWSRVPSDLPVRGLELVEEVDALQRAWTSPTSRMAQAHIPYRALNEIRGLVQELPGGGSVTVPTVQKLMAIRDHIREERLVIEAAWRRTGNPAPNAKLAENMQELERLLLNHARLNIPGNGHVRMQQAIEYSEAMQEMFDRSALSAVTFMKPSGAPGVDPRQAVEKLLKEFAGVEAVTQMAQRVGAERSTQVSRGILSQQPGEQQALDQLTRDLESYFRASLNEAASARGLTTMERGASALKYIESVQKQIPTLARLSADFEMAAQRLSSLMERRAQVDSSALARYMEMDPKVAIARLFSNKDAPGAAKALIQEFHGDPSALEGFRKGVVQHIMEHSNGDPALMLNMIRDDKVLRMLHNVFPADEVSRLDKMVDVAARIQRGDIQTFGQKHAKGLETAGRILSLQTYGLLRALFRLGPGNIQTPGLISQWTKLSIQKWLENVPETHILLREAIKDPKWEALLLSREPTTPRELFEQVRNMKRLLATGLAVDQELDERYHRWMEQREKGRIEQKIDTDPQMQEGIEARLRAGNFDQEGEGVKYMNRGIRPGLEGYTPGSDSQEFFQGVMEPISKGFRPNAFSKAMAGHSSTNIEDRRPRTISKYKDWVADMDANGYTQLPPGMVRGGGFAKRVPSDYFEPGGFDKPVPRPRPTEPLRAMAPRRGAPESQLEGGTLAGARGGGWTTKQVREAKELREDGKTYKQIGEELGKTPNAVSSMFARQGRPTAPQRRSPFWSTERRYEAAEMRGKGIPISDIAERLGTTPSAVINQLSRGGFRQDRLQRARAASEREARKRRDD